MLRRNLKYICHVQTSRRVSIEMVRFRTGNHNLRSVLYGKLMSDDKFCLNCRNIEETVEYFFINCPAYNHLHTNLHCQIPVICWTVDAYCILACPV